MGKDIYDDGEETLKKNEVKRNQGRSSSLTILAIGFLCSSSGHTCLLIFLNRCMYKSKQMSGFYNGETKVEQKSSAPAAQTDRWLKTIVQKRRTLKKISVQAGEGEAAIAARAGISIAQLEQLNPFTFIQDHGIQSW